MLGQEKTRELLEQELERLRNENHRLKEELTSLKEKKRIRVLRRSMQ